MADFETWESLGSNAYGTVYRGVQFSLKREVAVFQLDPALRKEAERSPRFWDEITQLAQLTDDRLVPVFAIDRACGWIVMELMCGNCAQLLARPQSADVARSILRQGLSGLERLHEAGRTHGDIRPHSLLINRGGRIKLSFSIGSAVVGGLPYQKRLMKYVAPEAVSPAFGEFGPAADLYTLGFSVLELLLGPKFDGLFPGVTADSEEGRTAWMRWHAGEDTKLPSIAELVPDAPLELVMVLDRLLKKHAAERYASATDALRDLAQAPLVPIVAPEIGVTGAAAGGAALVSDVDRIFDPNSKYDVAASQQQPAAGSATKSAGGVGSQAAAAVHGAAMSATAKDQKRKKNRKLALVAGLFLTAVGGIFAFGPGEEPAPEPTLQDAPLAKVTDDKLPQSNAVPKLLVTAGSVKTEIDELTPWSCTFQAEDQETPHEKLQLSLVDAPAGVTLDQKTGRVAWTPTEAQGPGKYTFRLRVADDGKPSLTAEQTLELSVREVNQSPVVDKVPDQVVALPVKTSEPALSLTIRAKDPDDEKAPLKFALVAPVPAGAKLDAATGLFIFAPVLGDELEPKPVSVTVEVADAGMPPLSARTSFQIKFQPGDLLAELRARLKRAVTVGEISDVVAAAEGLQARKSVDQKALRVLLAEALVKRGDANIATQDFAAAAVDFNKVVTELDVSHIDARLGRAYCYGRKGDWRAALTEYDDILGLDANNAAAYLNRATAHYELKDPQRAVQDSDRAAQLQPENPAVLYVRGNAKLALKDQSGAFADLKQAVRLFLKQSDANVPLLAGTMNKVLDIMKADPALFDAGLVQSYQQQLQELQQRGQTTRP